MCECVLSDLSVIQVQEQPSGHWKLDERSEYARFVQRQTKSCNQNERMCACLPNLDDSMSEGSHWVSASKVHFVNSESGTGSVWLGSFCSWSRAQPNVEFCAQFLYFNECFVSGLRLRTEHTSSLPKHIMFIMFRFLKQSLTCC